METLLQLWEYNDWANLAVLASLKDQETELSAQTMQLLSHIMNTQYVWLARIKGIVPEMGAWDLHSLELCKSLHEESSFNLKKVLSLHEHGLEETIAYTNSLGTAYSNTIKDILLHVFNHATYHRAQIATEMRKNGFSPLNTDYITFVRTSQADASGSLDQS